MAEGESLDVKIRLIGTDDTAKLFDALQKRLEDTNKLIVAQGESQKKVTRETATGHGGAQGGGIFGSLVKFEALKAGLSKGFHMIKDFFAEAKEVGIRSQDDLNGIIGTFTSKGSEANMHVVRGASKVVKEELEDAAIAAGVSGDQMAKSFEDIAQRSSHSIVEVENLVASMAKVSTFTRGGMAGLTQGFAQLEMGVVRAQNPIVQLIATTGVLKGNAQTVAQLMHKMSPAKQFELGEQAIARMNKKLQDAPLTMAQVRESMKGIKEQLQESIGEGLAGGGVTRKIHSWLMQHKEGINAIAKYGVGAAIGNNTAEEFKYQAQKHASPEVAAMLIGLADAAKVASDGLKSFASGAKSAGEWLFKGAGEFIGNGLAKLKGYKTITEKSSTDLDEEAFADAMNIAKGGGILNNGGTGLALAKAAMKRQKKRAAEEVDDNSSFYGMELSPRKLAGPETISSKNMEKQFTKQMQDFNQIQGVVASGNAEEFVSMYQQAADSQDLGRKIMMAEVLGGSEEMQKALFQSGKDIAGGFESLADFMTEASAKIYKANLKKFADVKGGAAPFIGHATFNLKQDFRQQDSDAIAMIFREDVAKNALYRVQNSLSTPNGG